MRKPLLLSLLSLATLCWSCALAQTTSPLVPASDASKVVPQVTDPKLIAAGIVVRPQDVANGDYGGFYTWPELVTQMQGWAKHTDIVQVSSLGKTSEGRSIPLFRISGTAQTFAPKPEMLYLVGVHPREQAPTVCIVNFMNELLSGYGKDPEITSLLDTRTIWVVPMLNVDGKIYDMAHGNGTDKGADWRKNRDPNGDGTFGTDLNRNFPDRWGGNRAYDKAWRTNTTDTKGNIYEGRGPASEPEVQAVMNFVSTHPLRIMLDLHSPLHDMRSPGNLSQSERNVFAGLLDKMRATQKDPYPLQVPQAAHEPETETRGGDSGISFPWSYYTTGAYSFNVEIGLKGRYPDPASIEQEYTDNIRGVLYTLLRECPSLKLASKGNLTFGKSTWEGQPAAGERVVWHPKINGTFSYVYAQSGDASGVIPLEFRLAPATSGFPILIQKNATPGTRIPLSLYVWTADRQVSVFRDTLTVK